MGSLLPSSILDEIARGTSAVMLTGGWSLDAEHQEIWAHHETGLSVSFSEEQSEFQVLTDLTATSEGHLSSTINYRFSAVLNLFELGILRIFDAASAPATRSLELSRFRWQDEYFSKFSTAQNDVAAINSRLRNATVCVVGAGGGLGSLIALQLGAAGVGELILVDGDVVEVSNLPRQVLFPEKSIGRLKVDVLAEVIKAHNSAVNIQTVPRFVESQNDAVDVLRGASFVALCADQPRLKIRAWVGSAALSTHTPSIMMAGSWIGPISVPFVSPCYLCQARGYRGRFADPVGFVNRALNDPLPARAAFGAGVTVIAGFMSGAILHFLTGTHDPHLLTRSFRVSPMGVAETISYVRYRECSGCGTKARMATAES